MMKKVFSEIEEKYKPNTRGPVISYVKKMDSSSLPLYSYVIKEKSNEKFHLQYMEQCYKPSKFLN